MFGDDRKWYHLRSNTNTGNRKWYHLRSNTNTGTQDGQARFWEESPHTFNASGYVAAQYAGPEYSTPYTGPGYSTTYAAPGNSKPYAGPGYSTPFAAPGNSEPYARPTNQLLYSAPVNSRQYAGPANPTPNAGSRYLSPYAAPLNSKPYAGPVNPTIYSGSGYPGKSSGPIPPPQYSRPEYSAQNDNTGKAADPLLADLISSFSATRIDERPSIQAHRPAPVSSPPRQDAIDGVVQEVLSRDLKTLGDEKLLPTNQVFDLARRFARTWEISDEAVNSHIRLACGYLKFPVILLLNPAPTHEFMPFDQMVDECKTLRWIEDVLCGIGLGLGDVIVLDACTLLGNDRIKQLGRDKGKKEQAMAEAYNVTQEMLRVIQPNIILSCQCSTSFPDWSAGGHVIARQLCSSIRSAKGREVKKVQLNMRTIHVIQAYHPSGFLNNKGDRKAHHDTFGHLLKGVFQTVYVPCASWKK